jgi:SAM-dependent methyltransferase
MTSAQVEEVACPVCGESSTRTLVVGDGWAMGRCRDCGLLRQNPRVTAAALRETAYDVPKDAVPTPRRSAWVDTTGLAAWESKPSAAYLGSVAAVEALRDRERPRGLWIDVGCQTGGLLAVARDHGYAVAGADVDGASAAFCRAHHGFDARTGTLAEAAFPAGAAGVVSYRQVLEHVHDLGVELAEVHRVLAPGGFLLVEVPHGGGWKMWLDRGRVALRLRSPRRLFHNVPQHLYYFRAATLARLLAAAGFEVLSIATYGRYRARRSWLRRAFEAVRDRLRIGNKLRLVARRSPEPLR